MLFWINESIWLNFNLNRRVFISLNIKTNEFLFTNFPTEIEHTLAWTILASAQNAHFVGCVPNDIIGNFERLIDWRKQWKYPLCSMRSTNFGLQAKSFSCEFSFDFQLGSLNFYKFFVFIAERYGSSTNSSVANL